MKQEYTDILDILQRNTENDINTKDLFHNEPKMETMKNFHIYYPMNSETCNTNKKLTYSFLQ